MGQRFLDPLYGPIDVDPFTRALVFSPDFQRLRYVRLCNINSLYLTGASEPKRFEHCLGVYHLARVWSEARRLTADQARVVCAAALLHDLQTGPFGHSFQYVLEDNLFDQQFEHANLARGLQSRFHQPVLAGAHFGGRRFVAATLLGDDAEAVFEAIQGDGPFGPIISGTIDLDNLDNVVRLAFHIGLCCDSDRALPVEITNYLSVHRGQLCAPREARPLFQRWFDIRRELYEYLLLDRGEFAAKAMLTLAVEMAVEGRLLGPDSWRFTDDEFLAELERESVGENQAIGQIVRRLRLGDLFEPIAVWTTHDMTPYDEISEAAVKRNIESQIERLALGSGATKLRCCLHLIKDHKKTRRKLSYLDSTSGDLVVVGDDSHEMHVGLFLTNARMEPLSSADRARYVQAARVVLASWSLTDLADAFDPLEEKAPEVQRELFHA